MRDWDSPKGVGVRARRRRTARRSPLEWRIRDAQARRGVPQRQVSRARAAASWHGTHGEQTLNPKKVGARLEGDTEGRMMELGQVVGLA
jgi:hypothetical protein